MTTLLSRSYASLQETTESFILVHITVPLLSFSALRQAKLEIISNPVQLKVVGFHPQVAFKATLCVKDHTLQLRNN